MSIRNSDAPIEIASDIYWLGDGKQPSLLNSNPYLLRDGNEGVLIDPGSPLTFAAVRHKVEQLVSLANLRYIILQQQAPSSCASTPLFEEHGFCGHLAAHWRAAQMIQFYGVASPFHIVNEQNLHLTFGTGRTLQFQLTPYLHCPSAIVTYDEVSKTLFSSDLFGAFSEHAPLYADQWPIENGYLDAMASFHEHTIPSNALLRPVIESISRLDIKAIAPQHGSIIRQDVDQYIAVLRELECGSFLSPTKRSLPSIGGYTTILNKILKRFFIVYPKQMLLDFFRNSSVTLDEKSGLLADFSCSGQELWHDFFKILHTRGAASLLSYIEPLVRKLSTEYSLAMPPIFIDSRLKAEETADTTPTPLAPPGFNPLHCPVTALSTTQVFLQHLQHECRFFQSAGLAGSLLFIGIDDMSGFNLRYGNDAGDETLRMISLMFSEIAPPGHLLFKIDGPSFACYLPATSKDAALQQAEKIRTSIAQNDQLLGPVTVSVGLVSLDDFANQLSATSSRLAEAVFTSAKLRLDAARRLGGNQISIADENDELSALRKILLVDSDEIHLDVLTTLFSANNYHVLTARDGKEALQIFNEESPALIISEVMLPKMDAFTVWEQLQHQANSRSVPFILTSHQKNEENVLRALALGIEHYYKKPYLLPELLALVELKFRQRKPIPVS